MVYKWDGMFHVGVQTERQPRKYRDVRKIGRVNAGMHTFDVIARGAFMVPVASVEACGLVGASRY